MKSQAVQTMPNILIVDDKRENLLALKSLLKDEESNILTASSGNEALSQLLEHECAVMLLDVQMPDMDGFETAALVRQNRRTRHVPIIFVTAINKEEKYVFRGYELGAVDYLFKPLHPPIVLAKVNAFLELDKQRRQLSERAAELENLNSSLCQVNSKLELSLRELRILNQDLEQFASIASHDLKEPVRTVCSFLQLLQKSNEGRLDEESKEYIQFAVDGVSRMNALISDLLDYARAGTRPFELKMVNCNDVIDGALKNLAFVIKETGAEVKNGTLPRVLADKTQLLQLFQNLLSNAIKFRGDKKPIIQVKATELDKEWRFAIVDNGIGIEKEFQERIFILFQRLHARTEIEGTGIGLAVCQRIAEQHGGRIWVESTPGTGSTFYFTVPKAGSCPPTGQNRASSDN